MIEAQLGMRKVMLVSGAKGRVMANIIDSKVVNPIITAKVVNFLLSVCFFTSELAIGLVFGR